MGSIGVKASYITYQDGLSLQLTINQSTCHRKSLSLRYMKTYRVTQNKG